MGLKARVATLPGHEITVEEQQEFRVDDLLPSRVMRPADAQDAARGLRLCDLVPAAVVTWGGGTQIRLGAPPRRYEVAFSMDRMTRPLEDEPADLTCRGEAGMRLKDLQGSLLGPGERLPLEPPHPPRGAVGGSPAADAK